MSDVAAQNWITENGNFNLETAPADVKPVLEAKKWSTVNDAIKSYTELEKFAGGFKNKLNVPEKLADEDIQMIYNRLGVPETEDKYEFKYDGKMPLDDALLGSFKKFAKTKNLTNAQFADVVKFQIDAIEEAFKTSEQSRQAELETVSKALKDEWKENYEPNFKKAKETAQKLELLEELESLGLADNPKVIKLMHKLNSKLSEDSLKPRVPNDGVNPTQELTDIQKSEAFKNKLHPDHGKVHRRFLELCGVSVG